MAAALPPCTWPPAATRASGRPRRLHAEPLPRRPDLRRTGVRPVPPWTCGSSTYSAAAKESGHDALTGYNVNAIALKVSKTDLALHGDAVRNPFFHYHRVMIEQALSDAGAVRTDLTTTLAINPHFRPLHAPRA